MTTPLILKRAPIGWNQDDYDVLEDGEIVGRIFKVPIAPQDRHWMWPAATTDTYAARRTDTNRRAKLRWRRSRKAGADRFRFRANRQHRASYGQPPRYPGAVTVSTGPGARDWPSNSTAS